MISVALIDGGGAGIGQFRHPDFGQAGVLGVQHGSVEGQFALRRAGIADAEAVRELFCRSYADTFGHIYKPGVMEAWLAETCTLEGFRAEMCDPGFATYLSEDPHGRLLGYCTLGPYDLELDTVKRWWVLRQLYLDPAGKGTGLGQVLMDRALDEARARGFEELYLTVWVDNHRARRFYERNGFVEVGRYEFVVGDQVDDDRIMRLTL
jgi:ribosomal protein S18 acetylase RimI-like enzyme